MHENFLLPDFGYLHPYHCAIGYKIDRYQDYKLQDMDVEDIVHFKFAETQYKMPMKQQRKRPGASLSEAKNKVDKSL
ncbi:hypothetical protein ABFV83_08055 [Lacrimispora sp. BS-2]|uniref:Uncharacterized protein n=1 Tax=Lacrimispora sp. BS-2 TaxID=3151850 RepID=A0AAU7PW17_9FIRM